MWLDGTNAGNQAEDGSEEASLKPWQRRMFLVVLASNVQNGLIRYTERLHQALNCGTPQEAYQSGAGKHHSENAEHHNLITA